MVLIAADPAEVVNRRQLDGTRNRDIASIEDVQYELEISKAMIVTCSVLTGSPFMIIMNNHNKMEDAASTIANMLSDKGRKN
jgi:adenylate kinase